MCVVDGSCGGGDSGLLLWWCRYCCLYWCCDGDSWLLSLLAMMVVYGIVLCHVHCCCKDFIGSYVNLKKQFKINCSFCFFRTP